MRDVFSPISWIDFPSSPLRSARRLCFLRSLNLVFLLAVLVAARVPLRAQENTRTGEDAPQPAPDVVVMIHPLSDNVTAVGVAYNKRVSHQRVQDDAKRLMQASGWQLAERLTITDESADPTRKSVPITTAARFVLAKSPQVANNAPLLAPYVRAFQTFNNLELVFMLPNLNPYQGVEHFVSPVVGVDMVHDEGVYRYEVAIHDHTGPLPEFASASLTIPAASAAVTNGTASPGVNASPPSRPLLGMALLATGAAILLGLATYSLRQRKSPRAL